MTPAEFRAALKALGMSQRRLAQVWGVDPVTVNRYATGKLPIPPIAAFALRLMLEPVPRYFARCTPPEVRH